MDTIKHHLPCRENRPAGRRSHRNFWMWGMVLTGLLCTALIGNVSQLKADKRALQNKLHAKDQVIDGISSSLCMINKQHDSQMQALKAHMRGLHRPPGFMARDWDGTQWKRY